MPPLVISGYNLPSFDVSRVPGMGTADLRATSKCTRPVHLLLCIHSFDHPDPGASTSAKVTDEGTVVTLLKSTSSGLSRDVSKIRSAGQYVHELRRISGLTWAQISDLFDVSRRTVHLWASGKPMTVEHETKLHRFRAFVHGIDRGESRVNRGLLLSVSPGGASVLSMLKEGRFQEVKRLIGRETEPPDRRSALTPLSSEARQTRRPQRPFDLIEEKRPIPPKEDSTLVRNLSCRLKRP
jgi:hypothetical protein